VSEQTHDAQPEERSTEDGPSPAGSEGPTLARPAADTTAQFARTSEPQPARDEEPPAAPALTAPEPVATVSAPPPTPTPAAPRTPPLPPLPAWTPPDAEAGAGAGRFGLPADRPELAAGVAFAGGFVLALILKRLAR
jgi:hypothetical protein